MGNNGSRVIQIDDVQDKLSELQSIYQKECSPYGLVHYVAYNDMQFFISESQTGQEPHPMSLHYFVPPNLLIISEYSLLEDINPTSLDNLLQIIAGVCEMVINGGIAGIGYNRIAYAGRWGIVGEKKLNWAYRQILETQNSEGVFLSPQLMTALSQGKTMPNHNPQKSDIFALGIMLVEMMFQEKIDEIFDYQNYEIHLKPLLEKLYLIRQQYGDTIYEMFIAMLEIQENNRIGFQELYAIVDEQRRNTKMKNSKMSSSSHSAHRNRTPNRNTRPDVHGYNKTPKGRAPQLYRNDVSPLRGRFAGNPTVPKRIGRTPPRVIQQTSRSPLRRDLKINTQFGRQSQTIASGYGDHRRVLSPISRR